MMMGREGEAASGRLIFVRMNCSLLTMKRFHRINPETGSVLDAEQEPGGEGDAG